MKLILYFEEITFKHIPIEENNIADALATLSSMYKVKWANEAPSINIRSLSEPAFCFEASLEPDGNPWLTLSDILKHKSALKRHLSHIRSS